MATAYLRPPTFLLPPTLTSFPKTQNSRPLISLTHKKKIPIFCSEINFSNLYTKPSNRSLNLSLFSSYGETVETDEKVEAQESEIQDYVDATAVVEDNGSEAETAVVEDNGSEAETAVVEDNGSEAESSDSEEPISIITASLRSYREALSNNDESKAAEIEAFLISIEDEKVNFEIKIATLSEELSYERDRVLRISADFDNFRKRTERERLSLVTNARGEVVENLLPVWDNFERAKSQIKIENEGEEKINNSYQSIYKQFVEILGSLGVVPVEPIGNPFDPLLHEAIMREESTEYEDGIVIEEYRKGFKLGDRLLRPSMVKVSSGPGPAKPETLELSEVAENTSETCDQVVEAESPNDE